MRSGLTLMVRTSLITGAVVVAASSALESGSTIGDVSDWTWLTVWQIEQSLPDDHVMIRTTGPIPDGWPNEIRSIYTSAGSGSSNVAWKWTPDGKSWKYLQVYGHGVPVEDALPEIAIVFERRVKKDAVAYIPVVYLELDHEGICEHASKRVAKSLRKHGDFSE